MKKLILAASLILATAIAVAARRASDSSTCPVTKVQSSPNGSAVVTFDCGSTILTIDEPIWP